MQQQFDQGDVNNIGRPLYFDLKTHIDAVIQMIQSDEIQIALTMLEQVPAYFRKPANYPKELTEIKNVLCRQLYSSIEYATDDEEFEFSCNPEIGASQWLSPYCEPRGEIITKELCQANLDGKVPFLVEIGCSHGNMPLGLKKIGCKFNYLGLAPNYRAAKKLREHLGEDIWREKPIDGQEVWFTCLEVLEHCMDSSSLVIDAFKLGFDYDQMFWSTPLGCLYGGLENYHNRRLGHVRCYNEKEFYDFVNGNFPGYKWSHYLSHSQVLHGKKA